MVGGFVRLTVSVFLIIAIIDLEAKPLNEEMHLKNHKCDDLTWTQRDDETWEVKKNDTSSSEGVQVWWPSSGRCVDLVTEKICMNRGSTILNSRFEGTCDCVKPYTTVEDKPGCHQYYEKGPCASGQVIKYDAGLKRGFCSKDLCAKENENIADYYERFIEVYGNGTCYTLDGKEACALHEKAELESRKIPHCSRSRTENAVYFPPACATSKDKFTCRIQIIKNENENEKHITQLKMDLE